MFIFHLNPDVFEVVKSGNKDIEMRLNDKKRRLLKIGDTIKFIKENSSNEEIVVQIKDLNYFKDFAELIDAFPKERLYLKEYSKEQLLELLGKFYSDEDQKKYGVIAIIFEKL